MKYGIAVFFALIMVSSTMGFIMMQTAGDNVIKYGKFKFTREDTGLYTAKINGRQYSFESFPSQVNSTFVSPAFIQLLRSTKMAYFTSSNSSPVMDQIGQSQYELGKLMQDSFGSVLQPAYTQGNAFSLPIITCSNATEFVPVIFAEYSNDSSVTEQGRCLVIHALSGQDLILAKDRIAFGLLGVIQ